MNEPTLYTMIANLSQWIDNHNAGNDIRLQRWQRIGKIGEEFGECVQVLIDLNGQNPRKLSVFTEADLRKEVLDTALTALCGHEHLTGNTGITGQALLEHVRGNYRRAGLCP